MPQMNGAEAMVATLKQEGVEVMFGIPGVQIMDAVDAVYRDGGIRWISPRHEQTAAYMAFGYARTTGNIGVAMVLPGPGALNTAAAIATAYARSVPVFLISGQIESFNIGYHHGVLHELDEQLDIFKYITKWCRRASRPEEIPVLTREALRQLKKGRPRPVELEVPFDLWSQDADINLVPVERGSLLFPDPSTINKAVELLRGAKKPLIVAGGGAANANLTAEITGLAEFLNAPVVMTAEGQGCIDINHPLYGGNFTLWMHPLFKEADVIIVIASRIRGSGNTRLELTENQKLIHVDHDSDELARNPFITLGINADAGLALKSLLDECSGDCGSNWTKEEIADLRESVRKRLENAAPLQTSILRQIHEVLPDDAILVPDITNLAYWCDIAYPVNRTRSYVDSSYFATLGYAFPTALGAKIGNPDKPVVVLCGDGGFPYASAELATAVQENINVIVMLFSDNAYGTVTGIQRRQFGGRHVGNRLHNPDYVKFAESFGAIGIRLSSPDEIGEKLKDALGADRPVIIECPVPFMDTPWEALIDDGK
ncbi:MAG: thiamine pyrophosphate-binding protein [Dehalococcoidales bacterium]|nr:thiamine pyrophosphate-binding protein [Dehalococcoidales bacterium]